MLEHAQLSGLRIEGFGGNERKIYTEEVGIHDGVKADVVDIHYVKTGTYVRGFGSSYDEWTGEYDYDPSYLTDQKTHKILTLNYIGNIFVKEDADRIEDINVVKIHKEAEVKC